MGGLKIEDSTPTAEERDSDLFPSSLPALGRPAMGPGFQMPGRAEASPSSMDWPTRMGRYPDPGAGRIGSNLGSHSHC